MLAGYTGEKRSVRVARFDLPDLCNLLHVFVAVRLGRNDQQPIEQIGGDTMWRLVFRSSNPRNPTVGSHNNEGCEITFECSVQEGETFDIEHVYLVDKEDLPGQQDCFLSSESPESILQNLHQVQSLLYPLLSILRPLC